MPLVRLTPYPQANCYFVSMPLDACSSRLKADWESTKDVDFDFGSKPLDTTRNSETHSSSDDSGSRDESEAYFDSESLDVTQDGELDSELSDATDVSGSRDELESYFDFESWDATQKGESDSELLDATDDDSGLRDESESSHATLASSPPPSKPADD